MALKGDRHFGRVVILYCAGRLVFGDETLLSREDTDTFYGDQQIVVNLAE